MTAKKLFSALLALCLCAVMATSAFASEASVTRYEPCPRCGNPTFEVVTYGPWYDTGVTRKCPNSGEGFYDMQQKRTIYRRMKCGQNDCGYVSSEYESYDYQWVCTH